MKTIYITGILALAGPVCLYTDNHTALQAIVVVNTALMTLVTLGGILKKAQKEQEDGSRVTRMFDDAYKQAGNIRDRQQGCG